MASQDRKSRAEVVGTATMAVFGLALMALAVWQSTDRTSEPVNKDHSVDEHKPEVPPVMPQSLLDAAVEKTERPAVVRLPAPPAEERAEKPADARPEPVASQAPATKKVEPAPAARVQQAARQPSPKPVELAVPTIKPLKPKAVGEVPPMRQVRAETAPLKPRLVAVEKREPVAVETTLTVQTRPPALELRPRLDEIVPEEQRPAVSEPSAHKLVEPKPKVLRKEPAVTVIAEAREQAAVEADGRILLRLLEHDSGPSIRIAWPEKAAYRERLYTVLSSCHGMESAWISANGQVAGDADLLGRDGSVDMDGFSGFVREARGELPRAEIAHLRGIARPSGGARVVRLFPRRVDAILLGGLRRLVGAHYTSVRGIVARYRLSGRDVMLEDIRVDGVALNHTLVVAPTRRCAV